MVRHLLILCFFVSALHAQNLDVFNGCPPQGHVSTKLGKQHQHKIEELNKLKNRYSFPTAADIDSSITLQQLIGDGTDDRGKFDERKAVVIEGYVVYAAKQGSVESCNCQSKDKDFQDQHIELALRPDEPKGGRTLVVEITPRIRQLKKLAGVNYAHTALAKLKGKKVRVTGWLLYDVEHDNASCNVHPERCGGEGYHRQTCWEVHPVTEIRVVR
jgi:hypothetical protein